MNYLMNMFMALTRLLNTLTGGRANQSFSARCHVNAKLGGYWVWLEKAIDTLFFLQPNHCKMAVDMDLKFNKK